MGGVDERNTSQHCNRITMLGRNYKCLTSNTCIEYSHVCDIRCPNKSDDDKICLGKEKMENCSEPTIDFMCLNGHCAKDGWCDEEQDCLYGEDEYLCVDNTLFDTTPANELNRQDGNYITRYNKYKFQLPDLPIVTKENKISVMTPLVTQNTLLITDSSESDSLVSYVCNRGIGIRMYNGSIICLCPPQYDGEKCQFHSDRISIILQLNFSHSIFEGSNDPKIILKLLVLFLFENQTLISYEFDVRPAIEMTISSKNINHVFYSRSNISLHNKRMRYFNRSNIINDHPYFCSY